MTVINPSSISGITSITMPSGDGNVLTIHTNDGTERFRIDSSGNVKVGSACTISQDGDVFFTGVCTATTLTGAASGLTGTLPAISGANLTNLPAANVTGTLPAISGANLTNLTAGNLTGALPAISGANLTGIAATDNVRTGILEVAGIATFSSDVKIGAAVTISESGIEASGIGITCANINGTAISGRRNMCYNGEMNIAQRATATSSGGGGGFDTVDRWDSASNAGGAYTSEQVTDAPDGYKYSYKRTITTANTTTTGSEYLTFRQRLEGQDMQHLKYGTASAVPTTLSFWVKSNKTGTYTVSVENEDGSIYNNKTYTINSSGTWEYKTLTYTGQKNTDSTTGPANDTGAGIELQWWLKAGPGFNGGTFTDNSWTTTGNQRVSGSNVNLADTVGNYWQITGVQWEVGSQATPFEHRSISDELTLCMRYFEKVRVDSFPMQPAGNNGVNSETRIPYHVKKRAAPTVTKDGNLSLTLNGTNSNNTDHSLGGGNTTAAQYGIHVFAVITGSSYSHATMVNSATFLCNAEI